MPVPYSEFQTPANTLAADGGPWVTPTSTSDLTCWTGGRSGICRPNGCVFCDMLAASTVLSFNVKFIANVSITMSQFGNADTLEYNFAYNFYWAMVGTAAGYPLSARVTVGSSSYTNNFGASDSTWLFYTEASRPGDPFVQSGTTSVIRSTDGASGYVPITIDFSYSRNQQSDDPRPYLIAQSFNLKSSATPGASPSSGAGSGSVSGSSSSSISSSSVTRAVTQTSGTSLSNIILPGYDSTQATASSVSGHGSLGSNSSSSSPNISSVSAQHVPIAAIVGGVLGGLSLLAFLALVLFLLYRKKVKELMKQEQQALAVAARTEGGAGGAASDTGSTVGPMTAAYTGMGFLSMQEAKYADHPNGPDMRTSTSSSSFTSPTQAATSPRERLLLSIPLQAESQQHGPRTRDHRRRTSGSNFPMSPNMDVPPPAYSDVNDTVETANEHHHESESEDEGPDHEENDDAESSLANERRRQGWSRGFVDEKSGLRTATTSSSMTPTATATVFSPGVTPR
ncbi:hypothetical protein FS842_009339 [Serendipita sp. 407]|nr:hypothetical protein FS842_009339 [Serendipita sp. 407]